MSPGWTPTPSGIPLLSQSQRKNTYPSSRLSRRARWSLHTSGTLSGIRGQTVSGTCVFFRSKSKALTHAFHPSLWPAISANVWAAPRQGTGSAAPGGGRVRETPGGSHGRHPGLFLGCFQSHKATAMASSSSDETQPLGHYRPGLPYPGATPSQSEGAAPTYLWPHVSRLTLQTTAPGRALGDKLWVKGSSAGESWLGGRGVGGRNYQACPVP